MRWISGLRLFVVMYVLGLALSAGAAEPTPESAWQEVISGQVEAIRAADAAKALSFAGATFQQTFKDPQVFLLAILQMGYAPIFESNSHSFGTFTQMDDANVLQLVTFIGRNQQLYEATYQLQQEPEGWRVQGVMLRQVPGSAYSPRRFPAPEFSRISAAIGGGSIGFSF